MIRPTKRLSQKQLAHIYQQIQDHLLTYLTQNPVRFQSALNSLAIFKNDLTWLDEELDTNHYPPEPSPSKSPTSPSPTFIISNQAAKMQREEVFRRQWLSGQVFVESKKVKKKIAKISWSPRHRVYPTKKLL